MVKKLLFFMLAVITAGHCYAQTFNDGTLNYTVITGTSNVQVIGLSNANATAIIIPATVKDASQKEYNVTEIGSYAFQSSAITSLDLLGATKLQTIGTLAFHQTKITSLDLSNAASLQSIGMQSFLFCTSLAGNIKIPANVTSIGSEAFKGTKITAVDLSGATKLQTIGDAAFAACKQLTTGVKIPSNVSILYSGVFGESTLPSIDLSSATNLVTIGAQAFLGTPITSIDFSAATKLQTIDNYAFADCTNLTQFVIPASVTTIGEGVFSSDTQLSTITVDASNKNYKMKNGALLDMGETTILAFPAGSDITSYVIPGTVTNIGAAAFNGCTKLSSITAETENNITYIGPSAFKDTKWYSSMSTTEPRVFYFGKVAYSYLGTMPANTAIDIQPGTVYIAADIFGKQTNLTSVKIPSSVEAIDSYAFAYCTGLTTLDLTDATSLKEIGYCTCLGCANLKNVDFAKATNLTTIYDGAFLQTGLETITMPASIKSINASAFEASNKLTTLDLSRAIHLETIGQTAFINCGNLATVLLPNKETVPVLGANCFAVGPANRLYYVKDGTGEYDLGKYMNDVTWNFTTCSGKIFRYLPKSIVDGIGYATIYLPYSVKIPTGLTAYTGGNIANGEMTLNTITDGIIPANTGCLLSGTAGEYSFLETTGGTTVTGNKLTGTIDAKTVAAGSVMTLGKEKTSGVVGFYKFTGTVIPENTSFIDPATNQGASKGIFFSFGDANTTGIDHPAVGENTGEKVIYDLTGRRVKNPQKGIYIVNGKKVIY